MAKTLKLSLDGNVFEVAITKIDRDKLYGSVEIEAFDEKGNPAELKVLAADGQTLINKGGTALESVNSKGDSIERKELIPVNLEGEKIELVKSSFDDINELKSADLDTYLGLVVKSVYLLNEVEGSDIQPLKDHLSAKQMFTFPFSYRGGLEYDAAYLIGGENDEPFMIIGKEGDVQYLKLNQAGVLSSNEEQEISADDISFDLL